MRALGAAVGAVVGAAVGTLVGAVVAVGDGLLEVVEPPQAATSSATASISVIGKKRRRDIICCVLLWYLNYVMLSISTLVGYSHPYLYGLSNRNFSAQKEVRTSVRFATYKRIYKCRPL